jgi:hypothetical protein
MGYHKVELVKVDTTEVESRYRVTTWYSKFDEEFNRGSSSYAYTSDGKILRWESNDAVVPSDVMAATDWAYQAEMTKVRNEDMLRSMELYIQSRSDRTPEQVAEERYEARAALGPGVDMVNLFTNEKYRT